jgi:Flp pilus assembly protein TadG
MVLDFGRVHLARTQLQAAVDAAALAGVSQADVKIRINPLSGKVIEKWAEVRQSEARAEAQRIFNQNVNGMNLAAQGVTVNNLSITFPARDSIRVSVDASMKTHLLGPMMRALFGDSSFGNLRVVRTADSKVEPD